jgi:hypothetical protein
MPTTGVGIHSKDPVKIGVIPAPHKKEFSIHRPEDMGVWTQVFIGQLPEGERNLSRAGSATSARLRRKACTKFIAAAQSRDRC